MKKNVFLAKKKPQPKKNFPLRGGWGVASKFFFTHLESRVSRYFPYEEGLFAMEKWFFASRNVFPCSEKGVLG